MAYFITEDLARYQPIAEASTVKNHALGTIVRAENATYGAGEFIYLQAAATTAVGSWVTYSYDNGQAALLAANAIDPVAVSMAVVAANSYGWFQISGKAVGLVAAGYVDNALVYATATAGTVDDAVVAGDRVKLAKGASAIGTPAAGQAEFEICRPFMDDGSAA
jgi:hypothetical protein